MRGDRRRRPRVQVVIKARGRVRSRTLAGHLEPAKGVGLRTGRSTGYNRDRARASRLGSLILVVVSRPARCPSDDDCRELEGRAARGCRPCLDGVTARQRLRTGLPAGADAVVAAAHLSPGFVDRGGCIMMSFPGRRPRRRRRRDRRHRRRTPGPPGWRAVLSRVVGLSRGGAPPLDLTSRRPSRVPPPTSPARATSCGSWSTRPGSSTAAGSGPRGAGASSTPRTWRRPSPSTPPARRS